MELFRRTGLAGLVAAFSFLAGLATPYPTAYAGASVHDIATAAPQTGDPPATMGERRLDGAAQHLERLTRELRGRSEAGGAASAGSSLALAQRLRPHLNGLRSLDTVLGQSAQEERAGLQRLRVPAQLRQRFESDQSRIRQDAAPLRAALARVEQAVAAHSEGEADAALDALAALLAKTDVTQRLRFDPATLRAQRIERETRQPAATAAQLQAFLAAPARSGSASAKTAAALAGTNLAVAAAPELSENEETQITPRIRSLADQLGRNPVAIFNWVRNNIDYVPTHGAIQGADLTLVNRRGNAGDTSSLLVALLRASDIPARFVYGTVNVPIEQAVNWLKADDADGAIGMLQFGGIPSTLLTSNGRAVAVRIQHLWVEAHVDFTPSRGAINREPDAWVPMDASFKQYTRTPTIDVLGIGGWNPTNAAEAMLRDAQIGSDGSITKLNTYAYQGQVDSAIGQVMQAPGQGEIRDPQVWMGGYAILASQLPVLSGTLPFAVSAATSRFAAMPDSLKYYLDIQLFANQRDIAYENPELSLRVATVRLGGRSVFVDYAPATAEDAFALKSYETSNAASLPLGSFRVIPRLKLGEEVLAEGNVVAMGTQQFWVAGVVDLQRHMSGTFEPYQFAAGSHISFTSDLGSVSEELLGAHFNGLPDSSRRPIAEALHLAGVQYWYLNDSRASLYARGWGGRFLRMPSVGVFAAPLQVRYFFGIPRSGSYAGFATDIKGDRVALYHRDPAKAVKMAYQVGSNGSLSESTTWDLLLNNRAGNSLSASSIIAWANRVGVPIYTVTADNVEQILPKLQTTADVKDEIRNAALAGLQVVVPQKEFAQGRIQAAGYVMIDSDRGDGIYRVDGGLNGALNVGCIAKAVLLKAICESKFARLMAARLAQLAARFAVRIGLAAVMAAVAPPLAIILPVVSAVLLAVTIIQVTYEVLTWVREVMNGTISLAPEEMAEAGIRAVNEYACNYLPNCFNNPMGQLGNSGFGGPDLGDAGPGGPLVGNPVSVATGVKTEVEVDYQGEGPFPLSFVRTYSSYLPNGSPIGHKWSSNYHQSLRLPDGATAMEAPEAVLAQRSDGGWQQYVLRAGSYVANADMPERMERITDGLGRTTQWRLHTGDDTVETYTAEGRLIELTDRSGLRQVLTYNGEGLLERVSDPYGRSLQFEYDPTTRQVVALIDPAQRRTVYGYDAGTLVTVDYPDRTRRQYHYETPGWPTLLTGITDGRGVRYASWKYDDENRVVEASHAGGADRVTLSYGDKQTTVVDARNTRRTYTFTRVFDTLRMTEVTEPCASCGTGSAAKIGYDGAGYPSLLTDQNGNQTQVRINARGLPEQWTRALGKPEAQTVNVRWHATWRLPELISETGATGTAKQTLLEYDSRGNPRKRTVTVDGQSRVWNYVYNAAGQIESEDGPRSDVADVTVYEYDTATGNRSLVRDANGWVTRYPLYDEHGRVLRMIDANGLVSDYRYDGRDRLIESKLTAPGGAAPEVTVYAYTKFGALERLTLPDGSWIEYAYDAAQRQAGVLDSLGNKIVYTLNPAGDLEQESVYDPSDRLVRASNQVFDALGRLSKAYGTNPNQATTFGYDGNGNLRTTLEPLRQNPQEQRYDALDRLRATIDPKGGKSDYDYDTQDNLRKVVDPRGLATVYDYNGFNELSKQVSPDTGTTSFGYDSAGNLARKLDARNAETTYRYDAANRLLSMTYPDETVSYGYDEAGGGAGGKGRLTSLGDGSGRVRYVYDAMGRLLQKSQQLGADSNSAARKVLEYSYQLGRVSETKLPSGARLRYVYGADGRVAEISVNGQTVAGQIEHFPYGEPKAWSDAAGRYERSFDADGRIDRYTIGAGETRLRYDDAGRIAEQTDISPGRPAWRFGYDELDRLQDATNLDGSGPLANLGLAWTFDANGNRTSQQRSGNNPATVAYTIDPASNRLTGLAGQSRVHDAAGNTTLADGQTFVYSARGRPVEARQGTAVLARYAYNAKGERVCSAPAAGACPTAGSAGSGYQQFVYDLDGRLIGEYDGNGNLLAEHVWLGDTPIAVLKPAATAAQFGGLPAGGDIAVYFVRPDQQNTPRLVVNAAGAPLWRWDSAPFGDAEADQDPSGKGAFAYRLRLPGQQFDAATGKHYNYFRSYDPQIGRYLESDPLGLDDGVNTYGYVGSDPLNDIDPDGLKRGGKAKTPPPHGNCRDFKGDCHVYMVLGPGGYIYKIGESCAGYNDQGMSKRCQRQANKLTAEKGRKYRCEIVYRAKTKGAVRDEEERRIKNARKCGCKLPGNKGNH
ncbi:DUF6531 domain-containing protein [Lysobacter sp. BMK333-48F3]|uniref:RHS repeat-associated core domain-containing protein n=1 Tax=Lysobacter sp. BMK333-48F3 TaxID=2867962 RepID=UPI001C8CC639|nr:RHS repeat-associated core domain-containing protein [Lysobacter sp. BMK333-48F3]MBX9399686.1 DUF6531 domain-containing protein [Lysobacter sp. BMK333-48F3]